VAGVARSGTTAIYEALQSLTRKARPKFSYFYEPYLWGPPTWGPRFRDLADAFTTTNSIHAHGLLRHLATPLFITEAQEQSTCHSAFVRGLFEEGRSSLVKIIRGVGRLRTYLDVCPDVKLVLVLRNPLDCVNSILGNFSFYGDEFHPSDLPRFREQLEGLGRPQPAFRSECEAATAWWYEMNEAALRSLETHQERVFVAPYEAYTADHAATWEVLGEFLSLNLKGKIPASLDEPVGQITSRINLGADDVAHIAPFQTAYFDLIRRISDIPIGMDARAAFEKIGQKYQDVAPGSFLPEIPRDASPLRIRALLTRERGARDSAPHALS
jgi:hypothetical protein